MSRRLLDCPACACLIAVDDLSCPFCGAPQRRAAAPSWLTAALIGGIGLTGLACDEHDLPTQLRSGTTGTSGTSGTSGDNTTTNETSTTSTTSTSTDTGTSVDTFIDSLAEGVTYAGPDESDSLDSATDPTSPTSFTTHDPDPDGATYAGPDEFTTALSTTEPPGSTTDEQQPSEKDACACTTRTRLPSPLLGLVALATLRRRPRPARRR